MMIQLDPQFYSQGAIDLMVQQFTEFLSVECTIHEAICLRINVNDKYHSDAPLIINTLLNNILDLSVQDIMNNER